MRRPFTRREAIKNGLTDEALAWSVRKGTIQHPFQGVYLKGSQPPNRVELALAAVVATDGVASHSLAGLLHELDSIYLRSPWVTLPRPSRRLRQVSVRSLLESSIIEVRGYRCTDGTQTMLDLATVVDDLVWEQALESALRNFRSAMMSPLRFIIAGRSGPPHQRMRRQRRVCWKRSQCS